MNKSTQYPHHDSLIQIKGYAADFGLQHIKENIWHPSHKGGKFCPFGNVSLDNVSIDVGFL
jgi:hypothetical protein